MPNELLHQKAILPTPERLSSSIKKKKFTGKINCAAHAWHLVQALTSLPLCLGFDSRAAVFRTAITVNFQIANKIRAFRKCCVIYLSRQPVTFPFIGFCESPSQTLEQTTSISSKNPALVLEDLCLPEVSSFQRHWPLNYKYATLTLV